MRTHVLCVCVTGGKGVVTVIIIICARRLCMIRGSVARQVLCPFARALGPGGAVPGHMHPCTRRAILLLVAAVTHYDITFFVVCWSDVSCLIVCAFVASHSTSHGDAHHHRAPPLLRTPVWPLSLSVTP